MNRRNDNGNGESSKRRLHQKPFVFPLAVVGLCIGAAIAYGENIEKISTNTISIADNEARMERIEVRLQQDIKDVKAALQDIINILTFGNE